MDQHLVLPSPALRPYIRTIMVGGFAHTLNRVPAMPDAHLVVYLKGSGCLQHEDSSVQSIPQVFVAGAYGKPRQFNIEQGSRYMAIVFKPGGFAAVFGMPADVISNQLVPLETLASRTVADALFDKLSCAKDIQELADQAESFLTERIVKPRANIRLMPDLTVSQLLSPVSSLASQLNLSIRQLERRFLAHAGMPLRDYRRMARFAIVLPALFDPAKRSLSLAHLAQDAFYVDQAHLVRDFRRLVGETPARFKKMAESTEPGSEFWMPTFENMEKHFKW